MNSVSIFFNVLCLRLRDAAILQVKKKKDILQKIMKIRILQNDYINTCSSRQSFLPQNPPIDVDSYFHQLILRSTEFSTIFKESSGTA